jgi:acetyltransferase-like isoleucine patch superfamily enzyme
MSIIETIISKLKKDPDYKFKADYTDRQLFNIVKYRGLQIARGFLNRLKIRMSGGLLFCGRAVVIENGYMIKSGPNLILEDYVQINALSENGIILGRNVTIGKAAIIMCSGVIANKGVGLEIGDYSAVGAQSFIGCQGGVKIGANVIMGPGVRIFSENHNYEDISIPIRLQGETRKGVVIEDDCWVGSGATILDGVTIGTGSLIAAGSVVSKSMPPFSVVAGVPAKVIKSRKSNEGVC